MPCPYVAQRNVRRFINRIWYKSTTQGLNQENSIMASQVETLSRREMLNRSLALSALASAQVAWPDWMPRLSFAPKNRAPRGDVLVVVFLRGGADGLNIIVPHGEATYYAARPQIGIARPDDGKADVAAKSLDLDGFFGLHPALS